MQLEGQQNAAARPHECGVRIVPLGEADRLETIEFPVEVDTILIRRDANWSLREAGSLEALFKEGRIVFPQDITAVGNRHLLLRRLAGGGWGLERQPAVRQDGLYYAGVNDRPDVDTLRTGDTLTLSNRKTGPRFRFELVPQRRAALQSIPDTEDQEKVPSWWEMNRALARRGALAIAVITFAMVGLGVWQFATDRGVAEARRLFEQAEKRSRERPDWFSQEVTDRLRMAAYLVVVEREGARMPLATAWPVSPTQMATNAHVALQIKERVKPGDRVLVCPPLTNSACLAVVDEPRLHPAYSDFRNEVERAAPGTLGIDGKFRQSDFPGAYDVAILQLEEGASAGPVLSLADEEDILALRAGAPIAFAGYPLRDVADEASASASRSPRLQFGYVSALTNFFMREQPDDPAHAQLLVHSIPVTGGTSGGPIINTKGKVVGIVSSGEVIDIPSGDLDKQPIKVPNAAMINYAQRIDLLRDIKPFGPGEDPVAVRRFWHQQLATSETYYDYVVRMFKEKASANQRSLIMLREPVRKNVAPNGSFDQFEQRLEKGATYAVLAYAAGSHGLSLQINLGGRKLADERGRDAQAFFSAKEDGNATIAVWTHAPAESAFELQLYRID